MGRTIVQEYGPIYGEPVNGTVQGRPNGSVYVPTANRISISNFSEDYHYLTYYTYKGKKYLITCDSEGVIPDFSTKVSYYRMIAEAQDLSSYIRQSGYSDAELTTSVGFADYDAGKFNQTGNGFNSDIDETLQDGDKVYLRLELMNNGTIIAVSDVTELTVVIP